MRSIIYLPHFWVSSFSILNFSTFYNTVNKWIESMFGNSVGVDNILIAFIE